ncbi:MAG TPA: nucleotidyltransferase domain-containing protein [Bacteroidales bacterium]|nr:nucleotidyltransferase domain-containing protein [Bacteroidales bacterium]HSA42885.1 nucleotidyltransferase domain-containing protein [Bacteroidales bacterium]
MFPLSQNIDQIRQICSEHQVEQLYIFGSLTTGAFHEQSDVDLLIQFSDQVNPVDYFDNYMDFKDKLETVLCRTVDIVENQAVRNPIFRNILDRDKILIYERKSA